MLRLSPQSQRMAQVVEVFRELIAGTLAPAEAPARLARLMPGEPCDGYWLGQAGLDWQPERAAALQS
jgi:hypothetical protein